MKYRIVAMQALCVVAGFFAVPMTTGFGQTKVTENVMRLDQDGTSAPASIDDVQWLTGHWSGKGLGGEVDEVWSKPQYGHMSGMFRVFKDNKLMFSELFTISEKDKSLVMMLRHFSPDLHGWEEKDKPVIYRLIKVESEPKQKTAWFDGLTYRLYSDGTLKSFVTMKSKNGPVKELEFEMKNAKAKPKK